MDLKDLRAFVTVAEELHFGRAAARLHVSPPPLTQRIHNLERGLGTALFRRTNRSVALTAAGVALLPEARRLLRHAAGLGATVQRAARGETGYIRAGVVGSAIFSQARELEANVKRSLPGVRIVWHELNSREQIDLLRQDGLDVGLVNTPIEHVDLVRQRTVREPMVAALPIGHPLAARRSIPLATLADEVFILGARHLSPALYDRIIAACAAAGFSPNIDHQANHMFTYISLVAIGAGISLVPASMAKAGMAGVAFVRLSGQPPYSEVSLLWNPDNRSIVLRSVLALVPGDRVPGDRGKALAT